MLFILQSELKQRNEIPFILVGNDSFPTCTACNFIPLFIMDQCGVEREKVPSSDCDEDEDFKLLTVINEHSEVIGLIKDDRDTNSQIGQNGVTNSNEIEIFHPHQIILNLTPMKLIPLMIIQMEMEMNLTLVKIILVMRSMKMTVTVKIRNITWFTKKKKMALRIIFISLK